MLILLTPPYSDTLLWWPESLTIAPPDTFPLLAVPEPGGGMVAEVALYGVLLALFVACVGLWAFRGYLPERPKWRGW